MATTSWIAYIKERKGNTDTDGDHFAITPESRDSDTENSRADNDKPIVGHRLLFLRCYNSAFSICTGSVLFTLEQTIA